MYVYIGKLCDTVIWKHIFNQWNMMLLCGELHEM
jgi:hypothetical protein